MKLIIGNKMKNKYLVVSIVAILLFSTILQAKENSFKTIPEKPKAGEEIKIIYNPINTPLSNAQNIFILAYFYSNVKNAQEVYDTRSYDLQNDNGNLSCKFKIDSDCDIVGIKFQSEEIVDNNEGNGYVVRLFDENGKETLKSQLGYASALSDWGFIFLKHNLALSEQLLSELIGKYPEQKIKYLGSLLTIEASKYGKNDKTRLIKKLDELSSLNGLNENDYLILAQYYKSFGGEEDLNGMLKKAYDKLGKKIELANDKYYEILAEKDSEKRMQLSRESEIPVPDDTRKGMPLWTAVMTSLAKEKRFDLTKKWWNEVVNKYPINQSTFTYVAGDLLENGDTTMAIEVIHKGESEWNNNPSHRYAYRYTLLSEDQYQKSVNLLYAQLLIYHSKILSNRNDKYAALDKLNEVLNLISYSLISGPFIDNYIKLIVVTKQFDGALKYLEYALKKGITSDGMEEALKSSYIKNNGSDVGFNEYWTKLDNECNAIILGNRKNMMLNEVAPQFTLSDLDGKNVSLADLKGKVVIVDFWATWCVPCKASFPGMQKAVNKFKDNKNVAFLFVNTYQPKVDKKKEVGNFIKDNKYTFHVLLDNDNKVAQSFKVSGIPTKFVIDKNGMIRFKVVGGASSDSEVVKELSTMVELAEK